MAFDEDRVPNLYDDRGVLQDIHSVSSLLKMYFRELPNPVCTYHLYDKFVEAAKAAENQRLVMMRDVVQQLPPPNYRYVMRSPFFYNFLLPQFFFLWDDGQQTTRLRWQFSIYWQTFG